MSKILFLNPPFSAKQLYGDLAEGGSELPPLGIALLAALTRQDGYETKIIDAAALKLNYEETIRQIMDFKPDFLGITSTTITIYNAADIAKIIKEVGSKMKIILGGPHLTACPQETISIFPQFDIGVVGEGEITLLELLKRLENNLDLIDCKGLIFKNNVGEIVFTGKREFVENLDNLPFPAWDLLPDLVEYYQPAADSLHRSPATLLITSRGCPGQCYFCENSMFGNRLRSYSADYVIRMIEYLQKNYGIRDIFFEDDNFLVFKERTREFCRLLKEKKIDITFSVMGRVDIVDPDTLKLLKEVGCWQINYGCESGSQKILDNINKGIKVEQTEQALKMTREAGLKIKGLFMIGSFGETKETIEETMRFIKRVPMDDFHITCFTPLPGTIAAKIANQYGKFNPCWKVANMLTPDNFVPNGLTHEELSSQHKRAYRVFYLRPRIIFYYLTKMLKSKKLFLKVVRGGLSFLRFAILGALKGGKRA
ncbi:radical SAM protein [Candidatus Falkowbacteria bacterium]|nr:radical SAM protein [Candidatus Falkowbacteria bacterium]